MPHFYNPQTHEACHFVPNKSKGGTRPTTIADARKLGLVPGVTEVLRVIAKPELERWKMIQAASAVLTSPRRNGEDLDAFMNRVLFQDAEQDQEAARAADKGKEMHALMEGLFNNTIQEHSLMSWCAPAYEHIYKRFLFPVGRNVIATEKILFGDGYAGMCDLILQGPDDSEAIIDFKCVKTLPTKGSWPEHRSQLSAYASTRIGGDYSPRIITTHNMYISTTKQGEFAFYDNPPWLDDFNDGFRPALQLWKWINNYDPKLQPA